VRERDKLCRSGPWPGKNGAETRVTLKKEKAYDLILWCCTGGVQEALSA
jgi:hypothetical protein